jgi:hypothetical protein
MIANHIHDALSQVRRLQEVILERRRFRGYSGRARILTGTAALVGAAILAWAGVPPQPIAHLVGWGLVLVVGLLVNYAALVYWFLFDPEVRRKPGMLKPALDALPALTVGAFLSVVLVRAGHFDALPGTWMCLYGLAQVAYRHSLPAGIYWVGLCYIAAGATFLLLPGTSFLNPWPMGVVFFTAECTGGVILCQCNQRHPHTTGETTP